MSDSSNNYKKFVLLMIVLMIVFAIIFFLAFVGLQTNHAVFGIEGIPIAFENWIIMILSIGSIVKIIYELINFKK